MDELMQPNAFILSGGSERKPPRATGEDRPLPLNSGGVQTVLEEVDGEG